MTIHVFIVDSTTFKIHLENLFAGTGAKDRVVDFNNNVIVKLKKKHSLDALLSAIKQGIVVNPRGMEPIGAKGVFEVVTSEYKDMLTDTTVARTPWTRQFYSRATTGPKGEPIPDPDSGDSDPGAAQPAE